jgi:predicted phage baseplate assembly protein
VSTPASWLKWPDAELDPRFQGITYLELQLALPKATLTVHLNRPITRLPRLTIDSEPGIAPLSFTVAAGATAQTLLVSFPQVGGPSTYTARLVEDRDGDPIHPFFTSADFVFTIDCERGDCIPPTTVAPSLPKKAPAIDYLTKDYTGFLQLLADRVRVTNPRWADLAPASFERVLVELLSHHGDMLSYFQDRVANEAFIDTASQRYSLRQHGVLLGYPLFDGAAAQTLLGFMVTSRGLLPADLSVRVPPTSDEATVVFHLDESVRVSPDLNALPLAAWPTANDAVLPTGATQVLLWQHHPDLAVGQRLVFTQGASTDVVTVSAIQPMSLVGWVDNPTRQATTVPADVTAVTFAPPLSATYAPFSSPSSFQLWGNLATARQGDLRAAFVNPDAGVALDRTSEVMTLDDHNSIVMSQLLDGGTLLLLRALRAPATPVLFSAGADGQSAPLFELRVDGAPWTRVDHLHNSQPFDLHYVATADEDGALWLQFGDGNEGAALVVDPALRQPRLEMRYRVGDPVAGNVPTGLLTEIVPPSDAAARSLLDELGAISVTNLVPGSGGLRAETRDAARLAIPASIRHGALERAVTLDDYAAVARTVPGVARSTARWADGIFNTVVVLIEPVDGGDPGAALLQAARDLIEQRRMAAREVFVAGPDYVFIDVELAICVTPGFVPHLVRDAVLAALRPGTSDRPGFFHPDRIGFGESLALSDVLVAVQAVPGVRSVKPIVFQKLGAQPSDPRVQQRLTFGRTQVARLDADEDRPEHGRLSVAVLDLEVVS